MIERQGPDGLYADASCCAYDLWVGQGELNPLLQEVKASVFQTVRD